MRQSRNHTSAQAKRLERLAAAIDAHRRGLPRRRLTHSLRAQVVAALDAGITVRAVSDACKVSRSQITRWRQAAAGSRAAAASSSAPLLETPRVLSVVDRARREDAALDSEIELRIGGWQVSLRRVPE